MTTAARELSVLVVDDEAGFRGLLDMELTRRDMRVETAENGRDGLRHMARTPFDVVITDITMPDMDGLELLREIKTLSPRTAVIVVTGFSGVETAVYAMSHGAFDFLLKPYDLDHLTSCVKKAADQQAACRACGRNNHDL